MSVAVLNSQGIPLMPTNSYRARRLLKTGRAVIAQHSPVFTIRLTGREDGTVQLVEYKCDTGYKHIGISVCSDKHEFVNAQYDMLPDETEHHNDQRKYRRARRNRLRYRRVRFRNRRGLIASEGFAPSIRHKRDCHIRLFDEYVKVFPISKAVFEVGQFDTQLLKALSEGEPLPQGTDYQQGEQYGFDTLREAVFSRDGYKCIVCGKSAFDGRIMAVHHIGFWKGDRSNRLSNLATVCADTCHTSRNHKPGGKLYGLEPKLKPFKGAAFMTSVRWDMIRRLREKYPDIRIKATYGARTKRTRLRLNITKSHSNDAYCMGDFHPRHRTRCICYKKRRRNNRILEKFYDAKYVDIRDGKKKSGSQLSCGRTNRRETRFSNKNERLWRGKKVSCGRRSIRKRRYALQPGDTVLYQSELFTVTGTHNLGSRVILTNGRSIATKKLTTISHAGGWTRIA